MDAKRIFVGRKAELDEYATFLEDPRGQAILAVGQAGIGKTWLLERMLEVARMHPSLRCGGVKYEVTATDSVDTIIALMMDHAFEAANIQEGSRDRTEHRLEQWRSLLNVLNLGDLVMSLRHDPTKNTRDQFLDRLSLISKRMPPEGRALFLLDPEKYVQPDSDQSWTLVVRDLPDKIKFVFAQRPEDALASSEALGVLNNILRIPRSGLGVFGDEDVEELLRLRVTESTCEIGALRESLARYRGHPYAIGAALDLIATGVELEELPDRSEPARLAAFQWRKVCEKGQEAIRLFEGLAVLETGVPWSIVEQVSDLKPAVRKGLFGNSYLRGLLREAGYGERIYHSILSDHILTQIGNNALLVYHRRAASVCRDILREPADGQRPLEDLAAVRVSEHAYMAEGASAFVRALIDDSSEVLARRALHDAGILLCQRGLSMVDEGSEEEVSLLIVLANIHDGRGQLDTAEKELLDAIETCRGAGWKKQLAIACGNLAVVYQKKGDLATAQSMHEEALRVDEDLGRTDGIASNCINLAILYDERGEHEKAEAFRTRVAEISGKVSHKVMVAVYSNLGLLQKQKGYNGQEQAETLFGQALEMCRNIGDVEGRAASAFNLGTVLCSQGKLRQGLVALQQAVEDFESLGNEQTASEARLLLYRMSDARQRLRTEFATLGSQSEGAINEPDSNQDVPEMMARGIFAAAHGASAEARKWLQRVERLYRQAGKEDLAREVERVMKEVT